MDQRPVLLVATSKTCPHCIDFHKFWPDVKQDLLRENKIRVKEISVPTNNSPIDTTGYPKDILRFIGWYPSVSLYKGDVWNQAENKGGPLSGLVYNGKLTDEGLRPNPSGYKFDKAGILAWIRDNISKLPSSPFSSSIEPLVQPSVEAEVRRLKEPVSVRNDGEKNSCPSGLRIIPKRYP